MAGAAALFVPVQPWGLQRVEVQGGKGWGPRALVGFVSQDCTGGSQRLHATSLWRGLGELCPPWVGATLGWRGHF